MTRMVRPMLSRPAGASIVDDPRAGVCPSTRHPGKLDAPFVPQVSAALDVPGRQHCKASEMSEFRGFGAGDERLGRVLRDAVEGRGRPVTASVTGTGRSAFVAAVERAPERRPAGERPRFGAIAVTAVLGGAVATAVALWPAVSAHRPPAGPRTAVAASPA